MANETVWMGLLPKNETTALDFIKENPEWDGRGVVVGILDTGVDPGAIGLQMTSDGKPKVIDIIDCTGSGDVKMGPLQKVQEDGTIDGALGYKLKVNPTWTCPTGEYRVGYKALYELYPSKSLEKRMREERKKEWTKQHQKHEQAVCGTTGDDEDTKALLEQLKAFAGECGSDVGPLLDCVTFHDGERWQAVVDSSETGDVGAVEPMCDYKEKQQFRSFSKEDSFNFSVKFYDNSDILSINVDSGAHGTHVAGITAAYHPDDPQVNGVAPGAQIVSLKIGDTRLGSMETGVGLTRALIEAVRCGCHVINMSFGEAAAWDNQGSIVKLAEEIVGKHGICYVGSAGNNGPAISTVGAPCGTSSCIISVGAFAAQSLMKPGYAMDEDVAETNYTWSSVGPTLDGHLGVSVMAPGGAVTCVPNWTLNKNQLMNGTSMSAPNASGCVALLLSASFANGLKPHPVLVRTAIENTALTVEGVHRLGQGHGLLQVKPAWELLHRRAAEPYADVSYTVSLNSERFERGIYLRQADESTHLNVYNAMVTPVFPESTLSVDKIAFEKRFLVRATEEWVSCPPFVEMVGAGKSLRITVDPRGLPVGTVSTAFVRGFVEGAEDWSFEVPVTVVRPIRVPDGTTKAHLPLNQPDAEPAQIALAPAARERTFFVPPAGCTFMEAIVTDNRRNGTALAEDEGLESDSRLIVCHALQTMRGVPYRDNEKECYFRVTPGSEHTMVWPVRAGVTMEFTLARYWSTLSEPNVSVRFNFKGLLPVPSALGMIGGQRVSMELRVRALLGNGDALPSVKLDKWVSTVKPSALGKVSPLGERDVLPDGTPLYQLVLEYDFETSGSAKATPRFLALQGILYEAAFHSQMWFIYDSNKKLVGVGDSWPKEKELTGGKYTLRLQVRHSDPSTLDGLQDMPMLLERSIKAITLGAFRSQSDAATNSNKASTRRPIADGNSIGYFFREPSQDSLPKGCSAGDVITGSFTVEAKKTSSAGDGICPRGYPFMYSVANTKVAAPKKEEASPPAQAKKEGGEEKEQQDKEEEKSPMDVLMETVRDAEVKHLKSLCGKDKEFSPVSASLLEKYPTHLPLLLVMLQHTVKCSKEKKKEEEKQGNLDNIVAAADAVVASIDATAVATALGTNVDPDDKKAAAARKEVDTQKSALEEACAAKAMALLDFGPGDATGAAAVDKASKELAKWTDLSADKYWRLQVAKHLYREKRGLALKRLADLLKGAADNKEKPGVSRADLLDQRDGILDSLGWTHVAAQEKRKAALCKHGSYAPF